MGELGCFSTGPPFFDLLHRPLSVLPYDRKVINTTFELYTPSRPKDAVILSNIYQNKSTFAQKDIDPRRKTVFIIHGYRGKYYMSFIRDEAGLNVRNVHIVGLSLGAHVAGYAGKRVAGLGRITGASPAGPLFTGTQPEVRLDKSDAKLVDCIHSDGNSMPSGGLGTTQRMCQLNVYPNGGRNQPGCPVESFVALALWYASGTARETDKAGCSHIKSFQFIISSVRNRDCPIYATACDSWENYLSGKCGDCETDAEGATCVRFGFYADQNLPTELPSNDSFYITITEDETC